MDASTPFSHMSLNPSGGSTPPNPDPTNPVDGQDPLLGGGSSIPPTANEPGPPKKASRARRSSKDFTWLPPGWRVEDKIRTTGASAGYVDKYYVDPASGHKFRSKNEVLTYLATGSTRKQKTSGEVSSSFGAKATENSESNTKKKNSEKEAERATPTFDPNNVPDSVEWVLTDADEDSWTPYLGGVKVDENEKARWEFAFDYATISDRE